MRIEVTQEHIDGGHRQNECLCPIALAVREAGYPRAQIGDAEFTLDGEAWFPLNESAKAFVWAFDTGQTGQTVSPFSFELELP